MANMFDKSYKQVANDSGATNLFDYVQYEPKSGHYPIKAINGPILMFDIVSFSMKMNTTEMYNTINAIQSSMYYSLDNDAYFWAEQKEKSNKNNLLFVSTGDGYAIALGNTLPDSEILKIANILYKSFQEKGLKFRMSIAKGRNILSIDMNDNLNIFGYGMVLATRVCDKAITGQILIHEDFANSLLQERVIPEFQLIENQFEAKHEFKFSCYNYYDKNGVGIDLNTAEDDSEVEKIKFDEIISNIANKNLLPDKKYWKYTDIFNPSTGFIMPKGASLARMKKTLWSDMISEYDARFLYQYIQTLNLKHNPDFDSIFQLWLIDENNHYLGFRELYSNINPLTKSEEEELSVDKSNFENYKQVFKDEFSILLALAYDELATVQMYTHDIETYQALGKQASKFIKKVISDEGWHYGKFFSMLKEYHFKALSNINRVKIILDQIIKLDGNPYQRTFILDHSRDLYTAEISQKVKETLIRRIENINVMNR